MELTQEERALLAAFRTLDDSGKKEVLRCLNMQHKPQQAAAHCFPSPGGHCGHERSEERHEIADEPIFTE